MPPSTIDNALFAYVEVDTNIEATTKRVEAGITRIKNSFRDITSAINFSQTQQKNMFKGVDAAWSKTAPNIKLPEMPKNLGLPKDFAKGFTDINKEIIFAAGGMPKIADGTKMMNNAIKGANVQLTKLSNNLKQTQKQASKFLNPDAFQGWAMSLMFAGMAMQRTAKSIRTFGTKAFDEITHSVEGATTQNDMLQGSMKYLGFTIGQALDPVLGLLIPIIDGFAQWVDKHPQLAAIGVTLLGIVGTLAMLGGMYTLAWVNGLLPLLTGLGILKTTVTATGVATTSFTSGFKNGINGVIGVVKDLRVLLGLGALLVVGYRIFGKGDNEKITTSEFLTNLGLATIGGFMAGGPLGALAGFLIALTVQLSHESVRQMLIETEQAMKAQQEVFKGGLTAAQANKIFLKEVTVTPDAWANKMQEEMSGFINKINAVKIGNILDKESLNPYNYLGQSTYVPGQQGYLYARDYTQNPQIADYSKYQAMGYNVSSGQTYFYNATINIHGDTDDIMNQFYRNGAGN